MKKYLLLFVALVFALSLAAGCGGGAPAQPAGESSKTSRLPDPKPQDNNVPATATKAKDKDDGTLTIENYGSKDLKPDPNNKNVFFTPDGRKIIRNMAGYWTEDGKLVHFKSTVKGAGLGRTK